MRACGGAAVRIVDSILFASGWSGGQVGVYTYIIPTLVGSDIEIRASFGRKKHASCDYKLIQHECKEWVGTMIQKTDG